MFTLAHSSNRAVPRTMRAVVTLLATVLSLGGLLGLATVPASAVGGSFDIDGVLDTGSNIAVQSDPVASSADNSYKGGAQEADACPTVENGSIPRNKDDFSAFYEGLDGNVLYLAFRRSNNNGTSTIDFELNQSQTVCINGVNKVRTDGDLLITIDFQGGSTTPVVLIRTFSNGSFSAPVTATTAQAEAAFSGDGLFGEVAVDLAELRIFVAGRCTQFTSALLKSRASSAFTSELKDFVTPIEKRVANCASITVIKDADLSGPTAFPFRFAPPSGTAADFQLVDDGSTTTPDSTPDRRSFADLADLNGSYVISETEPAATPGEWRLENITCAGGTATVDLTNDRVTVVPGGPVDVTCTFRNTFDPAPTVVVQKTARPSSIDEPGGPVNFDVVVTNTSAEPVTLTELTDTVAGVTTDVFTLGQATTCADNQVLAAADTDPTGGADTYRCTFVVRVSGNARSTHTDVVTARVTDAEGDTATEDDDAVVTIADVLPRISVTKTALTTTILEPGGPVTYEVVVTNLSAEAVTLTDLTDTVGTSTIDLFAPGNGSTCLDNRSLAAADATANGGADTYTCRFARVVSGNAGSTHRNTVDAGAVDDDGSRATARDVEDVAISNSLPTLAVLKTARTSTIAEPGGPVTFDVAVQNLSREAVTITALTDTVNGQTVNLASIPGTNCATGGTLAAGDGLRGGPDTYTCAFTITVAGNAGSTHEDTVRATVVDDDGSSVTAADAEVVTVANVAPSITVTKTASPTTVPEPGGTVRYTVLVRNLSAESVTLTGLTDTVGSTTNDVFAISGTTCRNGAVLAASDGAVGGPDTLTCTFDVAVAGNAKAAHTNVVEATVVDDDRSTAKASDDAVVIVTDVAPGIVVTKAASNPVVRVGDAVSYTYTVRTTTQESLTDVEVVDDKCAAVTFVSGDADGDRLLDASETWTFRCTSTLTVDTTNVATATGVDDEGNKATDTETASVDVINPAVAVDKSADRETAETGQTITYTYVVTNPGDSPLRPVSVTDDKCSPVTFVSGDTDGDGALDVGESWRYRCSTVPTAAGSLVNVAVVTATPPVGREVTGTDTATVSVVAGSVVLAEELSRPAPPAAVAAVTAIPPSPQPAPAAVRTAPATLPRTGSSTHTGVVAALGLLVIGGLALIPEHQRRRQARLVALEADR